MPVYGAFEAKNKLSELLDRALRGEEVVISRRGKPEVILTPCLKERASLDDLVRRIEETRLRMSDWRKANNEPAITRDEIRNWREEGRK